MNLFKVENFPDCEQKDHIILRLLERLEEDDRHAGRHTDGYSLGFDLDSMQPLYTKQSFVSFVDMRKYLEKPVDVPAGTD